MSNLGSRPGRPVDLYAHASGRGSTRCDYLHVTGTDITFNALLGDDYAIGLYR